MGRIGIYGGSFNPPHIGHIEGARKAVEALELDSLLIVPSRDVPGKNRPKGSATPEQRRDMLEIATSEDPRIWVSDWELHRENCRTWETVLHLKELYPDDEIVVIVGSDLLQSLHVWKNGHLIRQNASIAVLQRGGKGEKSLIAEKVPALKAMGANIQVVDNTRIPISSTQLRRLIAFGSGWDFLPAGVEEYIRKHGLYHVNAQWRNLPMPELEEIVISLLKSDRVRHVRGCRDTAVDLAKRWGANVEDAARAGILHDITKALDGPLQLTLCGSYGKILSDFSRKYPKTLHALTGSFVAEQIFGENPRVVSAICHHTTGKARMNLLEKIIYVADYMEPNRDFPGVERLRELAYTDLDAALKLGLQMTLEHLKRQGSEVSPESREALAYLEKREHK